MNSVMTISVMGLGYVGTTLAACLAREGHHIIGVDVKKEKVDAVLNGQSPIYENGVPELVVQAVSDGRLTATMDVVSATKSSQISFICVGTPTIEDNGHNYHYLERSVRAVGHSLKEMDDFHVMVVRSTVSPGIMESLVIPVLESASGKMAGRDFGVAFNPEFLREGTAIQDFDHPPKTVIAATDDRSFETVKTLYQDIKAPVFRLLFKEAEMVKLIDNTWHALKVDFANEIGSICKVMGIDSHRTMGPFLADRKLNISTAYLKPGFAFGGSCLPKDVRALNYMGKTLGHNLPVLSAIRESNDAHIARAAEMIMAGDGTMIGIAGLVFKEGTDDFRESPLLRLASDLIGQGRDLLIYEPLLDNERFGEHYRDAISASIPDIGQRTVHDPNHFLSEVDVVVLGIKDRLEADALKSKGSELQIIDLVRQFEPPYPQNYTGICW